MSQTATVAAVRSLSEIACEIDADWSKQGKGVSVHARPYLDAMKSLNTTADTYITEDAEIIILYFIENARTWRGDVARRVKAELKGMING